MAKRGRKQKANKNYFTEEQENAVIEYLNADTFDDKNRIYNTKLKNAFNKMVESIIRRYKLYIPDESFDETFIDTLSFLMTKMDKFNPDRHHKAYSYYGTICKNHLIARIQEYTKNIQKNVSYETTSNDFSNNLKYSYYDNSGKIASESIELMVKKMNDMLEKPEEYSLKENEIKTGMALKTLLENWDFVLSTDGSNKLNKSAILFFLKESTGFNTDEIRNSMKKFKNEFYEIKRVLLS